MVKISFSAIGGTSIFRGVSPPFEGRDRSDALYFDDLTFARPSTVNSQQNHQHWNHRSSTSSIDLSPLFRCSLSLLTAVASSVASLVSSSVSSLSIAVAFTFRSPSAVTFVLRARRRVDDTTGRYVQRWSFILAVVI